MTGDAANDTPGPLARLRARIRSTAWLTHLIDALAGLVMVAGLWLTMPAASPEARTTQLLLIALVLLGFLARRSLPRTSTAVVAVSTAVGWWLGVTGDPFLIAGLCLFVVAERFGVRRFSWWLVAGAIVLLLSILVLSAEGIEERLRGVFVGAVVMAASWILGVRTRQVRTETAQRVRTEERLRLSRDVHDVLSHTLGSIGVRAGVVAHIESASTDDLRSTLREVEHDSRAALTELRALLTSERAADGATPPAAPLRALVADAARSAERAGVRVTWTVDERAEALSARLRTTAHRIVQESVTNVIRHADATSCTVTVAIDDEQLVVEVRDDGRGVTAQMHDGHGLVGMRERTSLLGGTLVAGGDDDGFAVRAVLPISTVEGAVS